VTKSGRDLSIKLLFERTFTYCTKLPHLSLTFISFPLDEVEVSVDQQVDEELQELESHGDGNAQVQAQGSAQG